MYLLYKKPLETCLDSLARLKKRLGEGFESKSFTYAGRLDPLASGLILALEGVKKAKSSDLGEDLPLELAELAQSGPIKQEVLDLPKTYEFEVVFGVCTDTFDQLGLIYPSEEIMTWGTLNFDKIKIKFPEIINEILKDGSKLDLKSDFNSEFEMFYPFFSSKTIDGISLFDLTKRDGPNKVNKILPKRNVQLFSIENLGESEILVEDLANESIEIAKQVKGDFRQDEIILSWQKWLSGKRENIGEDKDLINNKLKIIKFRINCGSGFYVRSFAAWLGQIVGSGAIARNIFRTRIGDYDVKDAK